MFQMARKRSVVSLKDRLTRNRQKRSVIEPTTSALSPQRIPRDCYLRDIAGRRGELEETAEREAAFVESSRRTIMGAFVCGQVRVPSFCRTARRPNYKFPAGSFFSVASRAKNCRERERDFCQVAPAVSLAGPPARRGVFAIDSFDPP